MIVNFGNSGSSIKLIRTGSEILVEKIIYDYSYRDLQSVEKQEHFGNNELLEAGVQPVEFLSIDKGSTIINCKMRYINGLSGHNLSMGLNYVNQNKLCTILEKYFDILFSNVCHELVDKQVFIKKFDDIQRSNLDPDFEQYLLQIKEKYMVDLWSDLQTFPLGRCHGDLTFSNMFLVGDRVYLIDFLHTFLETPLQDIAKLRQDFVYGWSARFDNTHSRNMLEVFGLKIDSLLSKYRFEYSVQSALLEALCLLRIAPYVTDDVTKKWLMVALKRNIKES